MEWPDFFPSDCPPSDSKPASGIVYRLIDGTTPKERDFKSYRELYPTRQFPVPECQSCSLSVYSDEKDIDRLRRRIPATRKKKLSWGELNSSFGRILHTPRNGDTHHSWWLPDGKEPWLSFVV